jgi:TonB family protein
MFLTAAIAVPLVGYGTQKIGYVYCASPDDPVLATTAYSSPPMSIPVGSLNCGDKVRVLGRKESWVRIATSDGEQYVPITMLSQRNDRFVALNLPLPLEPRPKTGKVMPRLIYSPKAEYTQDALKAGIHGYVYLKLTIDADGKTHDVNVLNGLGYGLDENAVKAVQSWKFEPALQDGVPVEFKGAVEVEFPPKSN